MQEKIEELHPSPTPPFNRTNDFQEEDDEDDRSSSSSPPPPPPPRINSNSPKTKENEMGGSLTHIERKEENEALTTIFQNHLMLCFSNTKYDEDVLIKKKELLLKLLTKRGSVVYEEDLYRKELLMLLLFYENGVGDFSEVFINAGIKIDEKRFEEFVLAEEDLSENKDPKDFNIIYSKYLEYTQHSQSSVNETEGYESERSNSPLPPPPPRPRKPILQQPLSQPQEELINKDSEDFSQYLEYPQHSQSSVNETEGYESDIDRSYSPPPPPPPREKRGLILQRPVFQSQKDPEDYTKIYSQYLEHTQQPQNSVNETEGYESGSDRSDSPPPPPPPRKKREIVLQPQERLIFQQPVSQSQEESINKNSEDYTEILSQHLAYPQPPQSSVNETEGYESGSNRSDSPPPPPPPPRKKREPVLQQPVSQQQDFQSSRSNSSTQTTEAQTKKFSLLGSLKCFSSCCFLAFGLEKLNRNTPSNVMQNNQQGIQVDLGILQSPRKIMRPLPEEPIAGLSDQQKR